MKGDVQEKTIKISEKKWLERQKTTTMIYPEAKERVNSQSPRIKDSREGRKCIVKNSIRFNKKEVMNAFRKKKQFQ